MSGNVQSKPKPTQSPTTKSATPIKKSTQWRPKFDRRDATCVSKCQMVNQNCKKLNEKTFCCASRGKFLKSLNDCGNIPTHYSLHGWSGGVDSNCASLCGAYKAKQKLSCIGMS